MSWFSKFIRQSLLCLAVTALVGCSPVSTVELQDGYYTARMDGFDEYGWQEFLVICVKDDRIVSVEYNACNASGFIKSWDMDYMREMNEIDGTYPNEYTRIYSEALLTRQDPAKVDAVSGATHSHETFCLLAEAILEQARTGDADVVLVEHTQLGSSAEGTELEITEQIP